MVSAAGLSMDRIGPVVVAMAPRTAITKAAAVLLVHSGMTGTLDLRMERYYALIRGRSDKMLPRVSKPDCPLWAPTDATGWRYTDDVHGQNMH